MHPGHPEGYVARCEQDCRAQDKKDGPPVGVDYPRDPFSYGTPSALGATERPTNSTSTTRVRM